MKTAIIGVDFGTTNSSVALANDSGVVELAHFSELGTPTDSYRSLLYLERVRKAGSMRSNPGAGRPESSITFRLKAAAD